MGLLLGGAFTSSNNIGSGNETTLLSILESMMVHGMIVQGDFNGDHYGPVAVKKVDQRAEKMCALCGEVCEVSGWCHYPRKRIIQKMGKDVIDCPVELALRLDRGAGQ